MYSFYCMVERTKAKMGYRKIRMAQEFSAFLFIQISSFSLLQVGQIAVLAVVFNRSANVRFPQEELIF